MNKVLVILTNVAHYGTSAEQTGLWLAEATDFVAKVQAAGFQVDYASAKGGAVPLDPRSLKKIYRSQEVDAIYQSNDFQMRALRASLRLLKSIWKTTGEFISQADTGSYGTFLIMPTLKQRLDKFTSKVGMWCQSAMA